MTPPIYILTGNPKSGNSWIGKMLLALFPQPTDELAPWIRSHFVNKTVVEFNKTGATKIKSNDLLQRLLTGAENPIAAPEVVDDPLFSKSLTHLAGSIRGSIARSNVQSTLTEQDIRQRLLEQVRSGTQQTSKQTIAISKHTPLDQIRRVYPDAQILWVVRDPRDTLVSYFYHELSCLTHDRLELLFEDVDSLALKSSKDAIQSILVDRAASIVDFFDRSPLLTEIDERIHVVRYELMLDNGIREMSRLVKFCKLDSDSTTISKVLDDFELKSRPTARQSGSASLARKGITGDWKNYITQEHLELLPQSFFDLVKKLGYERDDSWMATLPQVANNGFDLARYRPVLSTLYNYEPMWLEDPELQERFPRPYDPQAGSYFEWLTQQDTAEIKTWFEICETLKRGFGYVQNDKRSALENKLGY